MKIWIIICAAGLLTACSSALEIKKLNGKDYERLKGVPVPEMALYEVSGNMVSHSGSKGSMPCTPTPAYQLAMQPTGETIYIDMVGSWFSDNKLSVEFHSDGTLKSINAEASAPATGATEVLSSLVDLTKGDGLVEDEKPACDTGFVPSGERNRVGSS